MSVIAVLTWYEETTKSLIAAVSSASTFVDHLVAVDGAYHAFPEARRGSGPEQQEQILSLAGMFETRRQHGPTLPGWEG